MQDPSQPDSAPRRAWIAWVLCAHVPALAGLAAVALWGRHTAAYYLRDVQAAPFAYEGGPHGMHPVTAGIFSQVGLVAWSAATAIAFLGWAASRGRESGAPASLLPGAAILSLLLLVDDGFLLHDQIFPMILKWPDWIPLVPEAALAGWWGWSNRQWILRRRPPMLLATGVLFAASLGLDLTFDAGALDNGLNLVEDGAKFLGILSWLAFLTDVTLERLAGAVPSAGPAGGAS